MRAFLRFVAGNEPADRFEKPETQVEWFHALKQRKLLGLTKYPGGNPFLNKGGSSAVLALINVRAALAFQAEQRSRDRGSA